MISKEYLLLLMISPRNGMCACRQRSRNTCITQSLRRLIFRTKPARKMCARRIY